MDATAHAKLLVPAIQTLRDMRAGRIGEREAERIREAVRADAELLRLVQEWSDSDDGEGENCLGERYAPIPRTLVDDAGQRQPNPEYDAEADVCGRRCPFGLWYPTKGDGEVQGTTGCLALLLFSEEVGIPLPPASLPNCTALRIRLIDVIPDVMARATGQVVPPQSAGVEEKAAVMSKQHVLQDNQVIANGLVYDHNVPDYVKWPDGTYVQESEAITQEEYDRQQAAQQQAPPPPPPAQQQAPPPPPAANNQMAPPPGAVAPPVVPPTVPTSAPAPPQQQAPPPTQQAATTAPPQPATDPSRQALVTLRERLVAIVAEVDAALSGN